MAKTWIGLAILATAVPGCLPAAAQPTFAVASIRPSVAAVQFEHDGETEITPGTLVMRDVSVDTCIKWAYGVQSSQISGPEWLDSTRFDILAKADKPVAEDQLKLMMQSLLAERFRLAFHRQSKELSAYALTVAKSGHKLKESASGTKPFRQNSANGTVAKALTMKEFADFMSGPMRRPVVDMTGLNGRYDFELDFTSYLSRGQEVMSVDLDNVNGIIIAAIAGELGLKLESKKEMVDVMIVDHVEMPSAN